MSLGEVQVVTVQDIAIQGQGHDHAREGEVSTMTMTTTVAAVEADHAHDTTRTTGSTRTVDHIIAANRIVIGTHFWGQVLVALWETPFCLDCKLVHISLLSESN